MIASDAPCCQRSRQRSRQQSRQQSRQRSRQRSRQQCHQQCRQRLALRLIQGRTTRSWCATRSLTGATLPSCVTSSVLIIWSSGFALALTGNSLSSSLLSFSLLLLPSPSPLIYSINRLFHLEEAEEERP